MTGEVGSIYTLHFDARVGAPGRNGAQHYVGFARPGNLVARLAHHANGTSGAKIMEFAHANGIGFTLVDVQRGSREDELRRKNAGQHARRCPFCTEVPVCSM